MTSISREEEIIKLNFKVLSKEKTLKNLQTIHYTVYYAVLAKYSLDTQMWNYQTVKGPLFLVSDTFKQFKLVILNQYSVENYIFKIQDDTQFQLKKLNSGYMMNFTLNDSITGLNILGIWSMDPVLEQIYRALFDYSQKLKQ